MLYVANVGVRREGIKVLDASSNVDATPDHKGRTVPARPWICFSVHTVSLQLSRCFFKDPQVRTWVVCLIFSSSISICTSGRLIDECSSLLAFMTLVDMPGSSCSDISTCSPVLKDLEISSTALKLTRGTLSGRTTFLHLCLKVGLLASSAVSFASSRAV